MYHVWHNNTWNILYLHRWKFHPNIWFSLSPHPDCANICWTWHDVMAIGSEDCRKRSLVSTIYSRRYAHFCWIFHLNHFEFVPSIGPNTANMYFPVVSQQTETSSCLVETCEIKEDESNLNRKEATNKHMWFILNKWNHKCSWERELCFPNRGHKVAFPIAVCGVGIEREHCFCDGGHRGPIGGGLIPLNSLRIEAND